MRVRPTVASTLIYLVAATPLTAEAEGIRAIRLSSGGLAEVTRIETAEGDRTVRVAVTADQVDDILKSLIVRDPGGTVSAISLDGSTQAEETFRHVPFAADDLSSPARLIGKLQGIAVKVESSGRTLEGKVLGVSERNAGSEKGMVRVLSLLTEAGAVVSVPLEDGATVAILDPGTVDKVAEAVGVVGKAKGDGDRRIEIALSGHGKREVRISYVVAAPVWKTSYRLVDHGDGKANLQAWAVIENATGEDWKGVAVTLSSGAPVALHQRLYQRYWRERPEVPVALEDVALPEIDPGTVAPRSASRQRSASRRSAAAPAGPMAPPPAPVSPVAEDRESYDLSKPTQAAAAEEGVVTANFALPNKIDLRSGRTLSVPIIDTELDAERVSLWKPGQGVHPVAALMIRNGSTATLPPGIVTVYDRTTGYVGDARLPSTPVGEQRMASFAADRKVVVRAEDEPSEALTKLTVVDGVAHATLMQREQTTYTVKGALDGQRTIVIEHPRRDGWTFTSSARDGETPSAYRLKITVPAGATAEVRALLERVQLDTYKLADADENLLVQWASASADPSLGDRLKALSQARSEMAAVEREIAEIDERLTRLTAEQDRIRNNLGAVPKDSELARRYLARMSAQEDEIAKVDGARSEADNRLKLSRIKNVDLVRNFESR